jgi:hypothetical protein
MNVTPELMFRTKSSPDTEDLALSFMEEEVGRFDWAANWAKIKESGAARQKIQDWLTALRIEHDPEEIASYLDKLTADRTGRWL